MRRTTAVLLVSALVLAACDQADEPELTTTTTTTAVETTTTTAAETTDTGGEAEGTTTTTTVGQPVEDYDVVVHSFRDEGEVLWVVIDPGDYTAIDLEGFVARVRDEVEGLWELHVFDDPAALEAARVEPDLRTEEERELIGDHHLVSLEEGSVISFRGPYEEAGEYVLGS